jgi:fido (protein-threonine AMPylation protein)
MLHVATTTYCGGQNAFSDRAAHYLGELNALHPFREGNGRAQREFMSHLAYASGYYIAWENMNRADMLHASINAFNGDTSKLAELIRTNLVSVGRGASTPAHLNKQNPPRPKSR